ncbi:unnamed protein product [Mucor hiemalis]
MNSYNNISASMANSLASLENTFSYASISPGQPVDLTTYSQFLGDDDSTLTVGVFKSLMRAFVRDMMSGHQGLVQNIVDALDRNNERSASDSSQQTFNSSTIDIEQEEAMDRFGTVLSQMYGTPEQRLRLIRQGNQFGERNLCRVPGAHNLKTPLLETMMKFYEDRREDVIHRPGRVTTTATETFKPDFDDLEERYAHTYEAVRMLVCVQIMPAYPTLTKWCSLSLGVQRFYSLLVEDYVHRELGCEEGGVGLPLFCTENYYAANYFLSTAIRSVVRSNRLHRAVLRRQAPIGGADIESSCHDNAVLGNRERPEVSAAAAGREEVDEPTEQVSIGGDDDEEEGSSPLPVRMTPAMRQEAIDRVAAEEAIVSVSVDAADGNSSSGAGRGLGGRGSRGGRGAAVAGRGFGRSAGRGAVAATSRSGPIIPPRKRTRQG